jgi:hypothetical protein
MLLSDGCLINYFAFVIFRRTFSSMAVVPIRISSKDNQNYNAP